MSRFWSDTARLTDPYVPGEQPKVNNILKLNTNENPYPPSPKVIEALTEAVNGKLRLYPDPTADELCETIARVYHVEKSQVFVGNGSDEVLAFSFLAFFNRGEKILFPDITYSFYPVYANLYGLDYIEIPLNDDFTIPDDKFFNAEGGVIFPNPNAPTSIGVELEKIEKIVQNNPNKVVIIDEAYIDFGGESAVSLINRYENLLIIQTLSKSRALAGLRVGFAIGSEQLIDGLNRIKNSFNSYTIDRLALAGAKAAIEDEAYFNQIRKKIIETRQRVTEELKNLHFEVLNSQANFLFVKHEKIDAKQIYETLKEKGIYVRYFNKPRIDQFLRITIGTDEEMNQFVKEIKKICEIEKF